MSRTRWTHALVAAASLVVLLAGRNALALPYMSQIAGTPCMTCHVNQQGGGMRTETGWGSMAYTGALQYEQLGLDWMSERESNNIIGDIASFGFDARFQAARVGPPTITIDDSGQPAAELAPWDIFAMQLQPYVAVRPHEMLTLYGTYTAGQGTFEDGDFCWEPYPGQSCWEAMAVFEPKVGLPTIRAGMIQPSIGIRHDDHTRFIRQDASRTRLPVIPPSYAEPGAEVRYQPVYWFSAEAGAYDSNNLAESIGDTAIVDNGNVAWNGRVTFFPQFGQMPRKRFNALVGGSTYNAGTFGMESVFAGLGWLNRGSLLLEASLFRYGADADRDARSLGVETVGRIQDWLMARVRVEQANATSGSETFNTLSIVGGFEFFPLPYIELRPEYRWDRTDTYESGQYSVQLHLFY